MEWLLTSIDPEKPNIAYGLYDLGLAPELGYIDLNELEQNVRNGWIIGNDPFFKPEYSLSVYFSNACKLAAFANNQDSLFGCRNDESYSGDFSHLRYLY